MVQALNPTRRALTITHEVDRWPETGSFRQIRVLVAEPRGFRSRLAMKITAAVPEIEED